MTKMSTLKNKKSNLEVITDHEKLKPFLNQVVFQPSDNVIQKILKYSQGK